MLLDIQPTQIIMVTYHRPNDFILSVQSILNHTECPFHLSIIDNSMGHINDYLDKYRLHPQITVYQNDNNIGKGAAVNKWYHTIMRNNTLSHFISIDSDIIVPPQWLIELQRSFYHMKRSTKVGLIAPAICNSSYETWEYQINHKAVMHNISQIKSAFDEYHGLYYNRYTAGPTLIIDTKFFQTTGMFYDKQLYGADDGFLCATAQRHKAFVGINSNVLVRHINNDSDEQYIRWKERNVTRDVDPHGRWG